MPPEPVRDTNIPAGAMLMILRSELKDDDFHNAIEQFSTHAGKARNKPGPETESAAQIASSVQ